MMKTSYWLHCDEDRFLQMFLLLLLLLHLMKHTLFEKNIIATKKTHKGEGRCKGSNYNYFILENQKVSLNQKVQH